MNNQQVPFTDQEIKYLSNKFKMLSEPSRLKIVRALASGEKCVTDIIEATGLLQANVSKQLKMLQTADIVDCRPQGLQRFYSLIDSNVLQICDTTIKARTKA